MNSNILCKSSGITTGPSFRSDCASSFFHIRRLPKTFQYIDYPPRDNFEFFTALEPYYHIVEKIFNLLDYRELRKCCLVNKSWKELAESTLAKRSYVTWFTYYRTKIAPRQLQFRICDRFWYNNVSCVIILFDYRRISTISSKNEVWTYLRKEVIPAGREYFAINCPSVVSHFSSKVKDVRDHSSPSAIDGLLIPKIPNIKTVLLQWDVMEQHIKDIDIRVEPDDEVKCLLLFMTKKLVLDLSILLDRLVSEERAVAVGGGYVRGTNTIQQSNKCSHSDMSSNVNIFCIAFLKKRHLDADFDAYSVVIQGNETRLEEKLLEFRSQVTIRKEAFGVMICDTDSSKMNPEKQSKIISKLFSDIPVLGFTALGEIGWNCFRSSASGDSGIKAKRSKFDYMDLAYHERSTVFVLITWGLKRSF